MASSSSAAAVAASSFHGFHRRGRKVRLFSDQPAASTKVTLNLDELSDYFLSPGVSGGVVRSFYDVSANALGTVGSNARVNLFDENDEHMCSLPLSLDTQLGAAQVDLHAGLASLCAGEKWSTIVKESESAARAKLSIIDRGDRAGCEVSRYAIEQEKNAEKEETVRQLSSWDMPQCSGQRMLVVDETACVHLFDARQGRAVHRWPGSTLSLAQRDGHLIYAVCGGVCKGRRQQVAGSFLKAFDVRYDPTIMSSRITHGMYPVRGLSHALPPGTPVALADAGQDGILLYLYSNEGLDHVRVYDMRSPTRGSVQLKLRPDDEVTGMVGATLAGPSPQQQVVCISTKTCLVVYMLQDILKSRSFLEVDHISEERAVAPCVRHQIVGSNDNSDSSELIGKDDFIVGMHRCPAGRLQFAFTHTSAGSTALDLDLLVDA